MKYFNKSRTQTNEAQINFNVSIAAAMIIAAMNVKLASWSSLLCMIISLRPQTNMSQRQSWRAGQKSQCSDRAFMVVRNSVIV